MNISGAYRPVLTQDEVINSKAVIMSPIGVQPYNFTDPKLEDCWYHILGFINDSQDLESLIASSAFFSKLLQPRKLQQVILPILMKNKYLEKASILQVRLVNKRTKMAIDKHLWLPTELTCNSVQDMRVFATEFPQCSPVVSSVSLLHDFELDLDIESDDPEQAFIEAVALLRKHGVHVRHLRASASIFDSRRLTFLQGLVQILSFVPNLHSLTFDLTGLHVPDDWQPTALPPLANLSKLHLEQVEWIPDGRLHLYPLISHLIDTYGSQLKTFSCPGVDFRDGIPFQTCKTKLVNLREFNMEQSYNDNDGDKQFKKLLLVKWPHLKIFALNGPIRVTYELLLSLCRYRETLEALEIEGELIWNDFTVQEFGSLKIDLGVFPKLTHLTIGTLDVGSDIWQIFKTQFVNLRHIRFHLDLSDGARQHVETQIPDAAMRRILFEMFPQLIQFIWEEKVTRVESGRAVEIGYKDIIFRRLPKKV